MSGLRGSAPGRFRARRRLIGATGQRRRTASSMTPAPPVAARLNRRHERHRCLEQVGTRDVGHSWAPPTPPPLPDHLAVLPVGAPFSALRPTRGTTRPRTPRPRADPWGWRLSAGAESPHLVHRPMHACNGPEAGHAQRSIAVLDDAPAQHCRRFAAFDASCCRCHVLLTFPPCPSPNSTRLKAVLWDQRRDLARVRAHAGGSVVRDRIVGGCG